jgi:hypothetical protein
VSKFYKSLANTARKLLKGKGSLVVFTRVVEGDFDPVLGSDETATAPTFSGYGAAFNYDKSEIDGTVIQSTDLKLLFEAGTEPKQDDTCVVNGFDYRVMRSKPISPAGTDVVYEIQLRV